LIPAGPVHVAEELPHHLPFVLGWPRPELRRRRAAGPVQREAPEGAGGEEVDRQSVTAPNADGPASINQ